MTTYSVPNSLTQSITYSLSLDGQTYNALIYWNIFGQRNYIYISDQYGNAVLTLPMIASPVGTTAINMLAGYFTTTMYYYSEQEIMVVT